MNMEGPGTPKQPAEKSPTEGMDIFLTQEFEIVKGSIEKLNSRLEKNTEQMPSRDSGTNPLDALEGHLSEKHAVYVQILGDVEYLRGQLQIISDYGETLTKMGSISMDSSTFESQMKELDTIKASTLTKLEAIIQSPAAGKIMKEAEKENEKHATV